MAQTGSRKRRRTTTDSAHLDQPSDPKKSGTVTKPGSRSTKGHATSSNTGRLSLQNVVQSANQGRQVASDAVTKVRAKVDEVLLLVEEERRRLNDSRSGRADTEAAESLAAQYAMHSHDPIASCRAYEDAKRAMQRFHSLVRRYETVNNQDLGLVRPTWMRWNQDAADLTTLNSKARAVSRQIVKGHLAPAGWPGVALSPPQSVNEDQELAQIALEIMDEAVPKGTAATWGSVAAQLVDSYGSILKDTFN